MSKEFYSINTVIIFCKSSNIERKLCITEFLILLAVKMLQVRKCFKNDLQVCSNDADYQDTSFSQYIKAVRVVLSQSVKGCGVH